MNMHEVINTLSHTSTHAQCTWSCTFLLGSGCWQFWLWACGSCEEDCQLLHHHWPTGSPCQYSRSVLRGNLCPGASYPDCCVCYSIAFLSNSGTPGDNMIIQMVRRRSSDEKVGVRKAALQALEGLVRLDKEHTLKEVRGCVWWGPKGELGGSWIPKCCIIYCYYLVQLLKLITHRVLLASFKPCLFSCFSFMTIFFFESKGRLLWS